MLDAGRTPPCQCTIKDIQLDSNNASLDLFGWIGEVDGEIRLGMARITEQGQVLPEIASIESPGSGASLAREADGHVLVGGRFQKVGDHPTLGVARFNSDGSLDRGFSSRASITGEALAVNPLDGSIFVGGSAGFVGQSVQKLDANSGALIPEWTATPNYPGARVLVASGDGILYIGGSFRQINGVDRLGIGRVSQSGSGELDSWQVPGLTSSPRTFITDESGSIYLSVGARVSRYDIASGARIWELSSAVGFTRLAILGDQLFAGSAACAPALLPPESQRCGVVRIPIATGTVDPAFRFAPAYADPDTFFGVSGLTFSPAGEMIVTGYVFDDFDEAGYAWRLAPDGDGTPVSGWNPSASFSFSALADAPNRVWIAGTFTEVSGVPRFGVAALPISTSDQVVFADNFE